MIRITFLGTAAARPTVGRNVSAIAVQREGDLMLFDCGEGTQRQMMRFGTGFNVQAIFVTHLHADHFLGITGLLRTMGLQGREDPIHLYGPPGAEEVLGKAIHLGVERVPFQVLVRELSPGDAIPLGEYEIGAFAVQHGTSAVGYVLREHPRLGRFDVERARALCVPEGPLFGLLHKGESVNVGSRTVHADEVVGDPRPGRVVVYTGDTRPVSETEEVARGADLLIHEATFGEEDSDRARETFHSTVREAALLARRAGVDRLILTHISARHSEPPGILVEEAREVFPDSVIAHDGLSLELGYRGDEAEPEDHEVEKGEGRVNG